MTQKKNDFADKISIEITKDQKSISSYFGYTEQEIAVIQNTVAKGTSKIELAYFINVCKTAGLNPFMKEIWCYKDKMGNLLVFSGRDGFLAKAQKDPKFNGIRSCEVCENDNFKIDIANNRILHEFGLGDRGQILGAYAIVFRKDGEPTVEFAEFKSYNKGYNAWKTHPAEMIKKVAEVHALKKAFGISGVQSEHDFEIKGEIATPIDTKSNNLNEDVLQALYSEKKAFLNEEQATAVERIINKKEVHSYKRAFDFLNSIFEEKEGGVK